MSSYRTFDTHKSCELITQKERLTWSCFTIQKQKIIFFFLKMILIFPSPNFRILKFEDLAVMRKTIGNVDSSH